MRRIAILSIVTTMLTALVGVGVLAKPGDPDPGFGTGGRVVTEIGADSSDTAAEAAVQPDGKIVAAGQSNASGSIDFAIARYHPDGTLDTGFGGDGIVTTDFGGSVSDFGAALALQADGRIVVAGRSIASGNFDLAVARYNPDGSLDTGFDVDGLRTIDLGGSESGTSVALQTDGKIVVAGRSNATGLNHFAVARLNPNGTLDTGFDADGSVITDLGGTFEGITSLEIQDDGKIVAIGNSNASGPQNFAVVRYNADGSLDTSFDSDGIVLVDFGGSDFPGGSALQPDGKILVAGETSAGADFDMAVARLSSDGSLDTTFDTDGKVTTDYAPGSDDTAQDVVVEDSGKVVAVGSATAAGLGQFAVTRYLFDGSLDPGFGVGGKAILDFPGAVFSFALASVLQGDGQIIAAGGTDASGSNDFALARFTAAEFCAGVAATISGTSGDDVLVGTGGPDVIVGLGGNDEIDGKGGNDLICGGPGEDLLIGGAGDDEINGDDDADTLRGGPGLDVLHGGTGTDVLLGESGDDEMYGGDDDDILNGGAGNDMGEGEAGDDRVKGGAGDDIIGGGPGDDLVNGGPDADVMAGGDGDDRLFGFGGDDEGYGGEGNDRIQGGSGQDLLLGEGGDDTVVGQGDDDFLDGGDGDNDSLKGKDGTDTCINGEKTTGCELFEGPT